MIQIMKKRLLILFIISGIYQLNATNFTIDGIEYTVTSDTTPFTVEVSSGCVALVNGELSIPETIVNNSTTYAVTGIGDSTFRDCSGLTSITIPSMVTSIGDYAFYGCIGLTSITIPSGVTSIGNYTFRNCSALTSITMPNGVTSIGAFAFGFCSGLTSITIPSMVTNIGAYAFYGCSGLTSITIPSMVTSIGAYVFYDCSGLTSITSLIEAGNLFDINANVFEGLTLSNIYLYVPVGSFDAYNSKEVWNEFLINETLSATNNMLKEDYLKVFPNPVKETLSVNLSDDLELKNVSIYDFLGKFQSIEINYENKINVSKLYKGVYIIEVNTNQGKIIKRFIKY